MGWKPVKCSMRGMTWLLHSWPHCTGETWLPAQSQAGISPHSSGWYYLDSGRFLWLSFYFLKKKGFGIKMGREYVGVCKVNVYMYETTKGSFFFFKVWELPEMDSPKAVSWLFWSCHISCTPRLSSFRKDKENPATLSFFPTLLPADASHKKPFPQMLVPESWIAQLLKL